MSETIGVITFVALVYGVFYIMAHRAEKEVRAKARQRLEEQQQEAGRKSAGGRQSKKVQA